MEKKKVKAKEIVRGLYDMIFGKYLFLFMLIDVVAASHDMFVIISNSTAQVVYFTDNYAFGGRPGRLFGLLALLGEESTVFIVLKVLYILTIVLLAYALYLLIRPVTDMRKKLFLIFAVTVVIQFMLYRPKRELLDMSLLLAFTFAVLSIAVLLRTKMRFLAPVFAAAAVFIECRSLILLIPAAVCICIFADRNKTEAEKKNPGSIHMMNYFMGAAAIAAMIILCAVSAPETADTDMIHDYLLETYADGITDDDLYFKYFTVANYLTENYYQTLVPPVLLIDGLGFWDMIPIYIINDIFHKALLLFIALWAVYDLLLFDDDSGNKKTANLTEPVGTN